MCIQLSRHRGSPATVQNTTRPHSPSPSTVGQPHPPTFDRTLHSLFYLPYTPSLLFHMKAFKARESHHLDLKWIENPYGPWWACSGRLEKLIDSLHHGSQPGLTSEALPEAVCQTQKKMRTSFQRVGASLDSKAHCVRTSKEQSSLFLYHKTDQKSQILSKPRVKFRQNTTHVIASSSEIF